MKDRDPDFAFLGRRSERSLFEVGVHVPMAPEAGAANNYTMVDIDMLGSHRSGARNRLALNLGSIGEETAT